MSYNDAIPQPTDLISNSQPAILGNFVAIDNGTTGTGAGFCRNHITMSDGTNGGLHYRVDYYQNQGSDPSVSGFVSSVYPKSVSGVSQLFFANASQVAQVGGPLSAAGNGYCHLFGGLIAQWGSANVADNGTANFPITFPNNIFSCVISPSNNSAPPSVPDVATFNVGRGSFQVRVSQNGSAGSTTINFVAFGN